MKQLILHIPHASMKIPFFDGFVDDAKLINSEILKLTDWHTDDLFQSKNDISVIADYSRIFCDAERFSDDNLEVMSRSGMGVLYKRTDDGRTMRNVTSELRERILTDYYWPHHQRLISEVNNQLKQYSKAFVLDCHSFSDTPFLRDLDQKPNRPDFCIGTDSFHTPKLLINRLYSFIVNKGYTVELNRPYCGCIIPLEHYHVNNNVQSIMLEVNRKLYMKDQSNEKSDKFFTIKSIIEDFIEIMRIYRHN